MQTQVVTNTQVGNFVLDGSYIDFITAQQVLPKGPQTNLIGIVGTGSWGKMNTAIPFAGGGAASVSLTFGSNTALNKSLAQEALSAMKGLAGNFLGVRVGDGTQAEATISVLDDSGTGGAEHTVFELTAVCPGTYPNNAASCRVDLQSGSLTVSPVFQVAVAFPGAQAQVWTNIVGYATVGDAYDAPTFIANVLAAVNGTGANRIASPYFIATAGASTTTVQTAMPYLATGGLDGDSGVTDTDLIGTDAGADSTGLYVLRSQVAGAQVILADFDTASDFQSVAEFCSQELAFSWETFAEGTTTPVAVSDVAANTMQSDYMGLLLDWPEVADAFQGEDILVSPLGVGAGIVASLPPWQDPGNHPTTGLVGVITTDRLTLGALGTAEAQQREANNINWIGKTPNGVLGLYHGLTSSGIQISDVRMRNYLGVTIGAVFAQYVGQMLETTLPFAQADENDPRVQLNAALNTLLSPMTQPGSRTISAYSVNVGDTQNTQTSMQQGFLLGLVSVTTLTGVRFAVAIVQIGNTVQIVTTNPQAAAA